MKIDLKTRIAANSVVSKETGCHEWVKGKDKDGYGKVKVEGRHLRPHRVVWQMENGDIPEGVNVLHRCDNPSCINLDHLFLGDNKQNMSDKMEKGRWKGRKHSSRKVYDLTVAQAQAIKIWLQTGMPGKRIAAKFDVTPQCISGIKNGRAWTHI